MLGAKKIRMKKYSTEDPVHWKDPSDNAPDGVVCGSDLEPLDPESWFGQPFTFHLDKVTCEECLSWINAHKRN